MANETEKLLEQVRRKVARLEHLVEVLHRKCVSTPELSHYATSIWFDPGNSTLTSDNIHDALMEVYILAGGTLGAVHAWEWNVAANSDHALMIWD